MSGVADGPTHCAIYQTLCSASFYRAHTLIIDRYLKREIAKPMVVVCTFLVTIFSIYSAARYLAKVVDGLLPGALVLPLVLLKATIALEVLLPIALHLSVVLGLGRLYSDSEMTALSACGVGPGRVLRNVFWLSLLIAMMVGTLSLVVRPWAYEQSYWLRARAAVEFDITKLEPGRFHEKQLGNRVIFVEKLNRKQNRVEGVFIQKEYGDIVQVIYAREAYHQVDETTGERILVCLDTHLYELSRNGNGDLIGQFGEVRIVMEEREIEPAGYKRKAASTTHLARSDSTEDIAELQWRLSTALSTMLLGLLGFPLSRAEARQGKYSKLLVAVLVYAGYYTLNVMAKTWVEQGVVGALPGIWWVNALLATLVLALLWPTARTIWLPRS